MCQQLLKLVNCVLTTALIGQLCVNNCSDWLIFPGAPGYDGADTRHNSSEDGGEIQTEILLQGQAQVGRGEHERSSRAAEVQTPHQLHSPREPRLSGLGRDVPADPDDVEVRARQEDHPGGGHAASLPQEAEGKGAQQIKQQLRIEIGETQ